MPLALFDTFPELAERLPYRPLGEFPTAIERIAAPLPGGGELWVKREDQSGLAYGGNKVRKLELLLADPPQGPKTRRLVTLGAYGSNQVLAAAIYGRPLGFSIEAVTFPQPITERVRRTVQAQLGAGAQLVPCRTQAGLAIEWPLAVLRAHRQRPPALTMPPGASSPLGNLGWWSGGLEIAAQVRAGLAPRFDAVYVALGSGGTAAGLLLGLGSAARELVAVRAAPWPAASETVVRWHAGRCRALLGQLLGRSPHFVLGPNLRIEGRFIGPGYGHATPLAQQAIEHGARLGMRLDPTYTGKTFAALLGDAQAGRLAGKRVLFINTHNSRDIGSFVSAGSLDGLPGWLAARLRAGGSEAVAG